MGVKGRAPASMQETLDEHLKNKWLKDVGESIHYRICLKEYSFKKLHAMPFIFWVYK